MEANEYTHLHVHTDASLLDGLGPVNRMIGAAKRIGFREVAMTDHGTLANAVSFSIACESQGIKPIIGLEGYISYDGAIGHISLLADGNEGWNSLLQLNNIAHKSEFKQPAFTIDQLKKYNAGLICMTGCIGSPFNQLSLKDSYHLGVSLKSVFGNRLFAELMFVGDNLAWERPMKLAEKLKLRQIITNDVHFAEKEDASIHPVLTQMKAGFDYTSDELYLKHPNDIVDEAVRFGYDRAHIESIMKRSKWIAEKLDPVKLASVPKLPKVPGHIELMTLIKRSDRYKLFSASPRYMERTKYEYSIISDMGFEDYFVILDDLIREAKARDVRVGPGRGSGAGSLILYFLGITDVDPIEHDLQFERFLNPERKGMPDVDVDIDSENRQFILDYASDKYDAIQIATYSRYSHKSLIRDLGKSFRADKALIDAAADKGANSDEFGEIMKMDPKLPAAYDAFMGQIRHKGKHAGGVIITDRGVPIERVGDMHAAAWTEGKHNELSYAGIVKFDLLGLSVLAALRRLETKFETKPESWLVDEKPFDIFRSGDLSGIFQFSGSEGIRQLTLDLQPNKFGDLVAINALYRPGAIDAGSTEKFAEWKKKPRPMPKFIEHITAPTYGAIVYQEQVMGIVHAAMGGSFAQADLARRIISKSKPDDPKWVKEFTKLKADFIAGAQKNGSLSEKNSIRLWEELETHVKYSFNKAHSTAYAMISWECAWWKYYHPADFYAQMLNVDRAQEQNYIVNAVESGIEVVFPDINKSEVEYAAEPGKIFLPLSSIKFFGENSAQYILDERKENGEFKSLQDLMDRVPKKIFRGRAREGFWLLGGLDSMIHKEGVEEIEKILALKEIDHSLKKSDAQLKYLGYIVPNKSMLKAFESYGKRGWECGIISSLDKRDKGRGPYVVYRLSPSGVFWSNKVLDLKKGQVVAANVNPKNGMLKKIKIL